MTASGGSGGTVAGGSGGSIAAAGSAPVTTKVDDASLEGGGFCTVGTVGNDAPSGAAVLGLLCAAGLMARRRRAS